MKKIKHDNRGSALISVIIAIAFIGILASSLMYMSFNNYSTKVMNSKSKSNFYGAESTLTKATTSLRNTSTGKADPVSSLKTSLGVNNADNRYDARKLASLAFPDVAPASITGTSELATVSVGSEKYSFSSAKSINAGANFNVDITQKLSNGITQVTIEQVKVNKLSGDSYDNSIITDIVFKYKDEISSTSGNAGIGDFSLMADSGIKYTSGDCSMNIYGNAYFGSPVGGHVALEITSPTNQCNINMLGDYMIVYGDIKLGGNAVLNIVSSQVTVLGSIYLSDNASLLCTGQIRFPDAADPNRVTGNFDIYQEGSNTTKILQQPISTITSTQYSSLITELKDPDTNQISLVSQLLKTNSPTTGGTPIDISQFAPNTKEISFDGGFSLPNVPNSNFRIYVWNKEGQNMNNDAIKYSLTFVGAKDVMMPDGSDGVANSTILSKYGISFSGKRNYNLSQLTQTRFDSLCQKTITDPNTQKTYLVGGFIDPNANEKLQKVLNYATGGDSSVTSTSSVLFYQNWEKK